MKPFDLEKAKAGAKLVTREGYEATDFTYNVNNKSYPCAAKISGYEFSFTKEGKWGKYGCKLDLFLAD